MDREEIMKQWDRWVAYYKSGGGGSWPRDAFEALLDELLDDQLKPYICPDCHRQIEHGDCHDFKRCHSSE